MIRGIHHIAVHTHDLERLLAFYRDVLGFQPVTNMFSWSDNPRFDQTIGVPGSAAKTRMLKAGNCYLEIFQYEAPPARDAPPLRPNDRGYTHFALDVTDIDTEFRRLQDAGMVFAHVELMDTGDIKALYGKDPDGNVIEIQQVSRDHAFAFENLDDPKAIG